MAGRFLDPLVLEFIDGTRWRVINAFNYYLDDNKEGEKVYIPADFITDFASIPRGLWNLFPPTGKYGKAAVVHDFLYQTAKVGARIIERGEADQIFRDAMEVLGVGWFTRWTLWSGLKVGGWLTWRKYRNYTQPTPAVAVDNAGLGVTRERADGEPPVVATREGVSGRTGNTQADTGEICDSHT